MTQNFSKKTHPLPHTHSRLLVRLSCGPLTLDHAPLACLSFVPPDRPPFLDPRDLICCADFGAEAPEELTFHDFFAFLEDEPPAAGVLAASDGCDDDLNCGAFDLS